MKIIYQILTCLLLSLTSALAVVISVPSPEIMLTRAPIIATGIFSEKDGKTLFTCTKSLKGNLLAKHSYEVQFPGPGEIMPSSLLSKTAGGNEVLFLCRTSDSDGVLIAMFSLCSVWPNGTRPDLLPQRTLAECLDFTRKILAKESIRK